MTVRRAFAACAVVIACAGANAGEGTQLTGEQILARAKAVFRSHDRPKYVIYTLSRRDQRDGVPDFENSYTLKLWCRTSDRDALTRRVWNAKPYGALDNITVAFDGVVDPGPPTADIFERALFGPASPAPDSAPSPLPFPTIGGVTVMKDYDYRVTRARRDGDAWHLTLEPRRDASRNRIDDLWVDAATYEVRRMRVRDHLYFGLSGQSIGDEFDARFVDRDGLPLLASIRGETVGGEYTTEYTYTNVSFPDTLPAWYFEPKTYGAHRADAPT